MAGAGGPEWSLARSRLGGASGEVRAIAGGGRERKQKGDVSGNLGRASLDQHQIIFGRPLS